MNSVSSFAKKIEYPQWIVDPYGICVPVCGALFRDDEVGPMISRVTAPSLEGLWLGTLDVTVWGKGFLERILSVGSCKLGNS